ncbi:penicillin-binding protein [Anaeroselena agilis]|uniref:Penicillin-binding transpeptidase domain-containing protein n=1 Tax=Anaeroselena agilis TaxID=3063788 RepID=A0ABU3P4P5_9FIRM|nr:penicillin-binding transpeptidase domain-containing protein [Selenomonadales bacterium 4137-cl]
MSRATPQVRKTIAVTMFLLLAAIAALVGRIAWVQFVEGRELAERSRTQLRDNKLLQSPRGTIYDRSGRELAISSLRKSLYVNPRELNKEPAAMAAKLAPILDMKMETVRDRLLAGGSFVWLKRTLEPETAQKVIDLIKAENIRGFHFIDESKRYYPNDGLAAQVLGFVGTDDIGLSGVEMALDKTIKGELVRQAVDTDSYGIPILRSSVKFKPVKQGKSVFLTIDSAIQFIVEQSLDKVMARTQAKGATVVIMNPRTGEILAMASRPGFDPNRFYRYGASEWKNRAVSIIYEPGSTFKAVVAAAALQENVVKLHDRFVDKGYVEVSGRRIKNWNGDSYGTVPLVDVIKNSINTCFVEIGLRLGADRLNKYARAFGFGKATDIELPGEEEGLLFRSKEMRDSDVATMAIGQSIAVTPLQLVTAVSAIANEGVLLKPYIVKEIYNADGTLASATPTQRVRQVISPETAKLLTGLLEKVVSEGGGKRAAVKGYRFAGKTGTAERLKESGGGYEAGSYIASFVGFGPVEDPQVAALVVIDDPVGAYYGGEIAAPVFGEIMNQVMRYLTIRPHNAAELVTVPAPRPSAPALAPAHQKAAPVVKPGPGKVAVPNVLGRSMRDAGDILNGAGLVFVPAGSGVAVRQSLPPNSVVNPGAEVTVHFEPR